MSMRVVTAISTTEAWQFIFIISSQLFACHATSKKDILLGSQAKLAQTSFTIWIRTFFSLSIRTFFEGALRSTSLQFDIRILVLFFFTDFRLKIFLWIFLDYSVWLFPFDFHGHNSLLIYDPKHLKGERMNWIRVGAVVRALASHQCVPGSIPGPDVICGLSLLLVLALAPRVFLRVLRFFSLLNNQHF